MKHPTAQGTLQGWCEPSQGAVSLDHPIRHAHADENPEIITSRPNQPDRGHPPAIVSTLWQIKNVLTSIHTQSRPEYEARFIHSR